MPWIESHTQTDKHPKIIRLQSAMGWTRNETVGFLHRFWYAVMELSPSGVLTSLDGPMLAEVLNMDAHVTSKALSEMQGVGLIDNVRGTLFVHDWLDYAKRYLSESRFKRQPEKLIAIELMSLLSKIIS